MSPPDRVPGGLIVAPPRHAKLDTFIVVEDAEPVTDRVEAVGLRQGVLPLVGEVDHRRAEDRPVAREADAAAEADLLAVAQILDRRVDVAVEAEIADVA